jgi:hypothetical protein
MWPDHLHDVLAVLEKFQAWGIDEPIYEHEFLRCHEFFLLPDCRMFGLPRHTRVKL